MNTLFKKTVLFTFSLLVSVPGAFAKNASKEPKNPAPNCHISVTSLREDGKKFNKTYKLSEVSKEACQLQAERHKEIVSPRFKRKTVQSRFIASEMK